jgi:hypothetical protein
MDILIDNQKVVATEPEWRPNQGGGAVLTLSFDDTAKVLDAWKALDPERRNYRWAGDEDDTAPSRIIAAWVYGDGKLGMYDVDPHWDGIGTANAYSLDELEGALGPGMQLRWGGVIGEDDVPPLPEWARTYDLLDPDERES